jgi:hypothetical protein
MQVQSQSEVLGEDSNDWDVDTSGSLNGMDCFNKEQQKNLSPHYV